MQVPRHKHAVVLEPSALRQHRLERGFVQIQTTRFGDSVFIVLEAVSRQFTFHCTSSRFVSFSGGEGEESVRPVKPAELDQTEFDIAGFVLLKRLAQLSNTGLDVVGGRVLERRDVDGAHDEN